MPITTDPLPATTTSHRVRKDLIGGSAFLALVVGGHLLWFAPVSGILSALG